MTQVRQLIYQAAHSQLKLFNLINRRFIYVKQLYTNEAGTSRRRAKRVIIENPSDKYLKPTITFVEEERIIMADGTEKLVEVGQSIIPIDETVLALEFPQFNVETGETTQQA